MFSVVGKSKRILTFLKSFFREDAEKQDEESEEDLIQKAEADFFAVIEAEMKVRDTKEKQQMESLKQMNKTLTGDGNQENKVNEELLEKDEVLWLSVISFSNLSSSRYKDAFVSLAPATHVKISQLVASLQTSRQQVVFARLVTSCQQVWNKLLTTCNNLVDIIRLVTKLFQQGCYNHDITILLQPCVVNLVTFLLYHDRIRLARTTL